MSSSQACLKRFPLLLLVFCCYFVGRSNGFQISPVTLRKRRNSPLSSDVVQSFQPVSPAPSLVQQTTVLPCEQQQHSLALNMRPVMSDTDEVTATPHRPRSRLFDRFGVRLRSTPNDEEPSLSSSKLRSFLSKVFDILARPVRFVVVKPFKWIRQRFRKKEDKVTEKYIEESIEEQATAVQKAIAEIEAKANEYKQKTAAVTTTESEEDVQDKTEPVPPKQKESLETKSEAEGISPPEPPINGEAASKIEPDTVGKGVATEEQDLPVAADLPDQTNSITPKQVAAAEAQTEIVLKVEDKQTKDAALASEEDMLHKMDVAEAGTQTTAVEEADESTVRVTVTSPALVDQATLDKTDLLEQEQQATAEAQSEVVEKIEAVQANDAVLATEEGMLAQLDSRKAMDADVMSEMNQPAQKQAAAYTRGKPVGDRWAVAAPDVDLSGEWSLIISEDFKKEYDLYLKQLGQPFLVRSVALTLIGVTKEETEQKEEGRTLFIRGTNARGIWERTLITSGADNVNDQFTPLHVPMETADDERVEAEAWWEDDGTVHRSWMRGIKKYGGGNFESRRYLEEGGKILVCESVFHPNENDRKDVSVTWRFLRNGETLDA